MSKAYSELAKRKMPNGKLFGGRYYSLTPDRPDSISDAEYQKLIKEARTAPVAAAPAAAAPNRRESRLHQPQLACHQPLRCPPRPTAAPHLPTL